MFPPTFADTTVQTKHLTRVRVRKNVRTVLIESRSARVLLSVRVRKTIITIIVFSSFFSRARQKCRGRRVERADDYRHRPLPLPATTRRPGSERSRPETTVLFSARAIRPGQLLIIINNDIQHVGRERLKRCRRRVQ